MAPNTITITSEPSVSPMPLFTDCAILFIGIPSINAAKMETSKKARKGFTLPQLIKRIRKAMHAARISTVIVRYYIGLTCLIFMKQPLVSEYMEIMDKEKKAIVLNSLIFL